MEMNERTPLFVSDLHLIGLIIQKREESLVAVFFLFFFLCVLILAHSNFHLSTIIIRFGDAIALQMEWVILTERERRGEFPKTVQKKKKMMMMMTKEEIEKKKKHTTAIERLT